MVCGKGKILNPVAVLGFGGGVSGAGRCARGGGCRVQVRGRMGGEGMWIIGFWCRNPDERFQLLSKKAIRKSLRYFATKGGKL